MDSLDGLRGFAALIVVFSHTSNSGLFFIPFLDLRGIGKPGVFLFFLLSSFLLTLPLLRKGREIFTLPVMSHYWQRRFFRIYPLYTVYLLFGVISTWIVTTAFDQGGTGIPFNLDWQGFIRHIALLEGKGVTWSIAVEFKFYFVLPLFVLALVFAVSYGPVATTLLLAALLTLSQAVSPQGESLVNDASLLPYMPIFIIGMSVAVLQDYINKRSNKAVVAICRYLGYLGVVGVFVMTPLVFSLFGESVPNDYFHKQFIPYAVFWSFILLSAVNAEGLLQRFFTLPVLRFYGALSFSLYLFHPIFIGLLENAGVNSYAGAWLVLLGSTATAYVSFRLVEEPMARFRFGRRTIERMAHLAGRFTRTR